MSMRPRLWSLNGLATELGRDRRTIGKMLATTPPDGRLSGHPAWFLTTALSALEEYDRPQAAPTPNAADALLGCFLDRVRDRRSMPGRHRIEWTIETMADRLGLRVETLLVWLKTGMPYVHEGNWATGAGFVLVPSWVIDWQAKLTILNELFGDRETARQLAVE